MKLTKDEKSALRIAVIHEIKNLEKVKSSQDNWREDVLYDINYKLELLNKVFDKI